FMLGHMYEYGEGVPKDDTQALFWLKKSANQGFVKAQFKVGYVYDTGEGVAQDHEAAQQWYKKALTGSHGREGVNAAQMFLDGDGVPKDTNAAISWYKLASQYGDLDADLFLGKAYRYGLYGLKANREISDTYFDKVSTLRMENSTQLHDAIYKVIDAHKHYPKDALKGKISGTTVIEFSYRTNKPFDIKIKKSSGNNELDNAALDAVKDSIFPLPPTPISDKEAYVIPVIFSLGS
ncbi:MAG: TonB family protein, partial [Candidatus Saccharimonadales bacterium]